MDKRFQVFVSSTFRDLQEERQAVMQALLEMDALPAGMELFPATNDDSWKLIQRIIEQSDYYVLIIGGRYGSINEQGLGFTEREYDYAMTCGVPVLPFLHEKPELIPSGKSEMGEESRQKLSLFRSKVESAHHCKFWKDAEQLGSRVSRGLMNQIKITPRTGWIRADQAGGADAIIEINRLRNQIETLNDALKRSRTEAPKGAEQLQGGDDVLPFKAYVDGYTEEARELRAKGRYPDQSRFEIALNITWNEAFAGCAPLMLQHEAEENRLSSAIRSQALELLRARDAAIRAVEPSDLTFSPSVFQSIKVQFIALGLITKSDVKRTASDKGKGS